ncbi:DNA cytosine methyltransferase [Lactococcus carnosus]|uniref:DNA cytosine methyltransferase n=1 Tax=Pseudolactococcus carnosus TaxID=2749961 RepID=UPI000812766B|nr:DNA cytosine methyltransferase [Lactococcus carnosus]SCA91635.1 Modification methylase HgiDII [Lactococcus piscium]MCJ1970063.1 DNA cytosine methyltransferase [Lactococcus carnosus]MCJ1974154.1 DNA cytosine methyltransferase [Lactococcus carnosus]MCJ1980555.1 DNA cytosine methyltransferase [Lactococcus carnosus]MCJ1988521.1 DNA cytosine methyltransferase [Lactococcus carnosus]
MEVNAIDLFCGVGGLTYGIQKTGINVVAGFDFEESCQFAYEKNNKAKFVHKNIKELRDDELLSYYPNNTDIKILIGCAPCQPFSAYSHRYKDSESRKEKMDLLDYFGKQVQLVKPDIVSMENVPQLAKEDIFQRFLLLLDKEGYKVSWKIAFAPAYGIPQNRKRLLLLASKFGVIDFPEELSKEKYPTVRKAISKLPKLKAGETDPEDPLHRSRKLSVLNMERIKSSKAGGTWRDWDEKLLPNCYKKKSGQSFGSVYGRLEWDKPSSTVTTQFPGYGNGRFGHPEQDRALSLREGAILQSFPKNYQFIEDENKYAMSKIAMQIGNAVPPKLGEIIGRSIVGHLKEKYAKL